MEKTLYGSIEAGGTKFVCAIGDEKLDILERISIDTKTPKETMSLVIRFFEKYRNELYSIGIGSFGPIDINKDSDTYGYITSTPKLAWQNYPFVQEIKKYFDIPIFWTTDVNAAAYGENISGRGKDKKSVVYVTIGTGIGGGAVLNDEIIEGSIHTEMGHMLIQRHPEDDFSGACPFHHGCLEGMAAGPAIEKRLDSKGQDLENDHSYWAIEAYYLAQCAYNITLILAPEVIVLGGGVMNKPGLLSLVRAEFVKLMNGYIFISDVEEYIVSPGLEDNAATIGCLSLAKTIITT